MNFALFENFTIEEWLDVLISAVDYNPNAYESTTQKMYLLRRLLPFIERRVNLIELAPMGTGKSYIYEKISKRGWLVSSGTISRASLLYDNARHVGGLITQFDFVAFDEIQSLKFEQPQQIQAALKSYMEFGEVKGFDSQIVADAGIIILGNIDARKFSTSINMVDEINPVFREAAIMDRFHGFIPGWEIPRLSTDIIASGWALNTEYFAEVLHELRDEMSYSALVDDCLAIPGKADKRDTTAITRLCTALVKLLYPNASKKEDIDPQEFVEFCLEPAKSMRQVIKQQLCILAPKEFDVPGKRDVPDIRYRY